MTDDPLPEEWEMLRDWLPTDLNGRARRHRFFQRARGLTDGECWLRLILMHVAGGLSLEQTAMRARELGLAQISGVALFKRLRRAEAWLRDLCQYLLAEQQRRLGRGAWPGQYRVRAIDATDIQEPGSTGTDWRIHYSIRLPELSCDHYELTDNKAGEKLGRFHFRKDELILADRGYSHRAGAAKVLDAGAALLLRWNPGTFPVKAADGGEFELLKNLRHLPKRGARAWLVQFEYEGKTRLLRLCAVRKNRVAAERSRRKALRKAKCNGQELKVQSLELTGYIMVLSSLPAEQFSPGQVLRLYQCRWQVELAFKRLKSLLSAGHVPKSDDASARAWMQAKILTSLLLERLLLEARIFSPWGYELSDDQPLAHRLGSA
jgi:Transposase DDE domain